MSIRLLIVDDHPLVRNGLRTILQEEPDFEVVGTAENGRHAIGLVQRHNPDAVLMDIEMPEMNGLEATHILAGPDVEKPVPVLILTTFALDKYVFEALRVGAAGFLLKDVPPETLSEAIRAIDRGHGIIAPEVTRRLISEYVSSAPDPEQATPLKKLSEREKEVLLELATGKSNAEIAKDLYLEETTVKTHVSSLLTKLGLRSRVQAVIFAYESGLVSPGR